MGQGEGKGVVFMGMRMSVGMAWAGVMAFAAMVLCSCSWLCVGALAVGDVNEGSCAGLTEGSPGFRALLPDCRAYEIVTPPYAGGEVAIGAQKTYDPSVSPDGERLLGLSFTGLAGTENEEQYSTFGAFYLFSRSASGWVTEALDPPASQYPHSIFISPSKELNASLWELEQGTGPGEEIPELQEGEANKFMLAVREAAGSGKGLFDVFGPMSSPGRVTPAFTGSTKVVGESADLSDVVFQVYSGYKQLWPGDQTREGSSSLYEYRRGMGSEPVLVGVLNKGALSGSPVNAEAELASECGIGLGSPGVDMYNAVSADGNSVVFSTNPCSAPQVKELYARIGGAKTLSISEPSGEACTACNTSVPMDATFQGASEDGSKVFFTTEQALLAGAEGSSLYEYDFNAPAGGRVRLIAPDVPAVARVSKDGSRIYFESTEALGPTPNGVGEAAEDANYNLYVYDTATHASAFVADLLTSHEAEGLSFEEIEARTRVTVADNVRPFDTSSDGSFLVFPSARHLTGSEDVSGVSQLFEYDAATTDLSRVSVGAKSGAGYECPETGIVEEGYDCDGNTSDSEDAPRMVNTPNYTGEALASDYASQLSVADDGMVAFESKDRLAPQAVAGSENVYEYRDGEVYVISPGTEAVTVNADGGNLTRLMETDTTGNDVYFFTTEALVPQDTDTQSSWYDARIGGGFPAPPAASGCSGDACQGPLSTGANTATTPASATAVSGGNAPPPAPAAAVSRPSSRQATTAQKLAKALKTCRRDHSKRKRTHCEELARKRFRVSPAARKGH